jgi:hypothetical protein
VLTRGRVLGASVHCVDDARNRGAGGSGNGGVQPRPQIPWSNRWGPGGEEWKVFDIFTDEVSLVVNYKRQFRRVITEEGWSGPIKRMEKKLKAEDEVL